MKKFRILILSSLIIFIISLCTATVFATGFEDTESSVESSVESSEDVSSDYVDESSALEPQEPETEPYYEPPTEPEYSQPESSEVYDTSSYEDSQTTSREVSSSKSDDKSLPQIDSSKLQTPTAVGSGVGKSDTGMVAGVVSWICVGVGIAVICGILVSSKTGKRK